jgi:hypothetical protein
MHAAPAAPRSSTTGIPRGAVVAGSIVLVLVLGFFGLGRLSFLSPEVTTPQTLDGLGHNEGVEALVEPVAASQLKGIDEDHYAVAVYGSGDRALIAMPFRDTVSYSSLAEMMQESGITHIRPVGDGLCGRAPDALVCAVGGFNSAAIVMETTSDPAFESTPQHLVDLADGIRP